MTTSDEIVPAAGLFDPAPYEVPAAPPLMTARPSLIELTRAHVADKVEDAGAREALLMILKRCDRLSTVLLTRDMARQLARDIAFAFDVRLPAGHAEFDAFYDASDSELSELAEIEGAL